MSRRRQHLIRRFIPLARDCDETGPQRLVIHLRRTRLWRVQPFGQRLHEQIVCSLLGKNRVVTTASRREPAGNRPSRCAPVGPQPAGLISPVPARGCGPVCSPHFPSQPRRIHIVNAPVYQNQIDDGRIGVQLQGVIDLTVDRRIGPTQLAIEFGDTRRGPSCPRRLSPEPMNAPGMGSGSSCVLRVLFFGFNQLLTRDEALCSSLVTLAPRNRVAEDQHIQRPIGSLPAFGAAFVRTRLWKRKRETPQSRQTGKRFARGATTFMKFGLDCNARQAAATKGHAWRDVSSRRGFAQQKILKQVQGNAQTVIARRTNVVDRCNLGPHRLRAPA